MTLRGIDVSHWQGAIDWGKVAQPANDLQFAIVKIGGADAGLYTDAFGADNLKKAVQAGLETGAYWFFNRIQPLDAQAQRIDSLLLFANVPLERGLWIDVEGDISLADVKAAYTLIMALRVRGYRPGIYTRANIWNAAIAADPTLPTPDSLDIPLWVAHYKPPDVAGPIVPNGWARWTGWQFSAKGVIPGISGDVDMDLWDAEPTTMPPETERGAPRIDYARVVHVAPEGATLATFQKITEVAYKSDRQTVGFSYDDAGVGDLSSRKAILWDIPANKRASFTEFYAKWYRGVVVEFRSTTPEVIIPPVDPPPVTTGKTRLGVNVVTGNGDVARRALAARHTAISIINNFQLAGDLSGDPKITVMARRYMSGTLPPPDPDLLYEGANYPNVVYLGLNEQDVSNYGTPQEIAARAAWDRDMWAKMKAKGRRYAGGGFSVGTPDYTRADICDAMRTHYAPLYNSGMALNYHLYSPWQTHEMDIWYELRWRFLFEKCGFDPNPNLGGIYCDETGMDRGSVGGFPACGMDATQIGAWCRRFLDASQGSGYGNLLRAAAIFQAGNTSDWNGYNVDSAFAEIGTAAQAPVTVVRQSLDRPRMIDTAVQPIIAPTPRKVISQWEAL